MRVLIVEDEQRIAAFLERGLKEEGWYEPYLDAHSLHDSAGLVAA